MFLFLGNTKDLSADNPTSKLVMKTKGPQEPLFNYSLRFGK
jgi:hypothetical protein